MCHVLIIEDEALIALDLEDLLSAFGARSFSFAATQRAAVDCALEHRPDFILSDVSLAEGSGPKAVAEIRCQCGAIPTIYVTATPEACMPCEDPDRIFRKPLDRRAIGTAFREMAFPV